MSFPIVSIDTVKKAAKAAAERGDSLNDACPWPFYSDAGRQFKQFFIVHKAALQALATESLS
ncbi:hypothetical protein [Variovorax sp. LT1R16]|uniref:hypothetical protein n=1 Tax=Variovorax sp. LT1R16 TaxID=3443728 RepID=UPI003F47FAE3